MQREQISGGWSMLLLRDIPQLMHVRNTNIARPRGPTSPAKPRRHMTVAVTSMLRRQLVRMEKKKSTPGAGSRASLIDGKAHGNSCRRHPSGEWGSLPDALRRVFPHAPSTTTAFYMGRTSAIHLPRAAAGGSTVGPGGRLLWQTLVLAIRPGRRASHRPRPDVLWPRWRQAAVLTQFCRDRGVRDPELKQC